MRNLSDAEFASLGYGQVVYIKPSERGSEIHAANGELLNVIPEDWDAVSICHSHGYPVAPLN